jgi:hypothetical protein
VLACLSWLVAAVGEPPRGILLRHRFQGKPKGFLQRFMGSGPYPSQKGFELGEGFFDGGIIRRIGWQKEQFTASCLDELPYSGSFLRLKLSSTTITGRLASTCFICSRQVARSCSRRSVAREPSFLRLQPRRLKEPQLFGPSSWNGFGYDCSRDSPLVQRALDGCSGHAKQLDNLLAWVALIHGS